LTKVHLHIGLPKSGTTYLQQMVEATRSDWERAGWLIPRTRDQIRAVQDAVRHQGEREWKALSAEMLAWQGPNVLLSVETLCRASGDRVSSILESLSGARVHVVVTARDIARSLPAQWQQSTQHRKPWSWNHYRDSVLSGERSDRAARSFWSQHDLERILARWSSGRADHQVSIVTVPHTPGTSTLWDRFTASLSSSIQPHGNLARANESLGATSGELLARVNQLDTVRNLSDRQYNVLVRSFLARDVLASRRELEAPVRLEYAHKAWADREASRVANAVKSSGVALFGELEDLRPTESSFGESPTPTSDELLEAATLALGRTVERMAGESKGNQRRLSESE